MVRDSLTTTLHVNSITLSSLSSSYEITKYYVVLSYGIWKISTTLNQNNGPEICWKYPENDINMIFHVSIDELISQKFEVQVWDNEEHICQGNGSCTLESSLKSYANGMICVSIFLVDKNMKEFGIADILIRVIKPGFLSPPSPQKSTSISHSKITLRQESSQIISSHSEPISAVKAAITKVNPDGTCTIRLENDSMNGIQFVTGVFQIPSDFQCGEHVIITYPGSISRTFPGIISRSHPDGTFTVRYQNGTREMRLPPSNIKKIDSLSNSSPVSQSFSSLSQEIIESGIETVSTLHQQVTQNIDQTQLVCNLLDSSQHIFKRFSELHQQERQIIPLNIDISWNQRQLDREIYFQTFQENQKKSRCEIERRIEEMKRFSVPKSLDETMTMNSNHLHYFHYAPLLFAPFKKEILKKYAARRRRRQATFVIKRFFLRVIAWVRVVIAVRSLTRKRVAYKRRLRREEAALIIQSFVRKRSALKASRKRRFSAIIISKAMKSRRDHFMRIKELEDEMHLIQLVFKIQRIYRWNRNRRRERLRKQIEKENVASKKIQKLFRQKWKRPVYLSELVKNTMNEMDDEEEDEDDVMILRSVPRPPIETCRGYWIEINEDQIFHHHHATTTATSMKSSGDFSREGLIEGVDFTTKTLIVDFGSKENPEEYEVDYNSEHIKQWFVMTSRKEQDRIVKAAIKIQIWAKRKLNLKYSLINRTISAINSAQSLDLSHSSSHLHLDTHDELKKGTTSERSPCSLSNPLSIPHKPIKSTEENGGVEDSDSVMILRPIPRPTIEKSVGYWVSSDSDPDREALIEEIDIENRTLKVEYLDDVDSAVLSYDDPSLTWYRMSTKKEEEMEVKSAIRIQTIVRGRLARARYKVIPKFDNSKVETTAEHDAAARIQRIFRKSKALESRPRATTTPSHASQTINDPHPLEPISEVTVPTDTNNNETPSAVAAVAVGDNSDEMELIAMDTPPVIFNCPGYWIIRATDPEREGIVESVDLESQMMRVVYEDEYDASPNGITTVDVSYTEPNLLWYGGNEQQQEDLFLQRKRPLFDKTIGCYILILDEEDTHEENHISSLPSGQSLIPFSHNQAVSSDMALIVDLIPSKKSLKIQFVQKISRDGRVICDEEIEEVPYASKSLIWLKGKLSGDKVD